MCPSPSAGDVPADAAVEIALNVDRDWHLDVDGRTQTQVASPDSLQRYDVETAGSATLEFRGGLLHRLLLLLQAGFVIALLMVARRAYRGES